MEYLTRSVSSPLERPLESQSTPVPVAPHMVPHPLEQVGIDGNMQPQRDKIASYILRHLAEPAVSHYHREGKLAELNNGLATITKNTSRLDLLGKCLPRLAHSERQALVMATCFDMKPSTIADILDLTEESVRGAFRSVLPIHDIQNNGRTKASGRTIKADEYALVQEMFAKYDWPRRELIVSESPSASISWRYSPYSTSEKAKPPIHDLAFIDSLRFGVGEVAVTGSVRSPTLNRMKCAHLAALGMENKQISEILRVSLDTVKTHLGLAYRQHGVRSRTDFIRLSFENETYTVSKPGVPLRLHKIESDAVSLVSRGLSNTQIAKEIGVAATTITQRLKQVFKRNNLNKRAQLALAFNLGSMVVID